MARKKKATRAAWGSLAYDPKTKTARIRYWAETESGYRRCSKTFRNVTRKEAEEKRLSLMLEHGDDKACPTVRQVYNEWFLPGQKGNLSDNTIAQYESAWRSHIEPTWGDVFCDEISPLKVQQWLSGIGRSAALNSMKVLRPALDYAVRYDVIKTNPFRERYIMPSKSTVNTRNEGAWDEDELGAAWKDCMGEWWEPAFLMMAFGGCRVGESIGVRCEEVRFDSVGGIPMAFVPIMRQIDNFGNASDTLKTEQSYRTAIIPGIAGVRVAHLAAQTGEGWLTGDGLGGPTSQRALRASWKSWCESTGRETLALRALRPSWQTMAKWRWGLPTRTIERLMGHAGKTVTARHYDRPEVDAMAQVVAKSYEARPYDQNWSWAVWDA